MTEVESVTHPTLTLDTMKNTTNTGRNSGTSTPGKPDTVKTNLDLFNEEIICEDMQKTKKLVSFEALRPVVLQEKVHDFENTFQLHADRTIDREAQKAVLVDQDNGVGGQELHAEHRSEDDKDKFMKPEMTAVEKEIQALVNKLRNENEQIEANNFPVCTEKPNAQTKQPQEAEHNSPHFDDSDGKENQPEVLSCKLIEEEHDSDCSAVDEWTEDEDSQDEDLDTQQTESEPGLEDLVILEPEPVEHGWESDVSVEEPVAEEPLPEETAVERSLDEPELISKEPMLNDQVHAFTNVGASLELARQLVQYGFKKPKCLLKNEERAKAFMKTLKKSGKKNFQHFCKRLRKQLKKVDMTNLRAPIGVIMGNVDVGKTKLLDCIRHTKVQACEAGGITQQIGVTNLPREYIIEQAGPLVEELLDEVHLPGLCVIDTPGHEAFGNLRERGTSMADIAIVVLNILDKKFAPTMVAVLRMLKESGAPFIVALNQIDRLVGWQSYEGMPIDKMISLQSPQTQSHFEDLIRNIQRCFAEFGFNSCLHWESEDLNRGKLRKTTALMVPTSAHTGDGVSDLLLLWVKVCQTQKFAKKLLLTPKLNCTILECKKQHGLGNVIDVIISDGTLKKGDTIVVCGMNGPIRTQIRSLLVPSTIQDLRARGKYVNVNEVHASTGCRISGVGGFPGAVAGSRVYFIASTYDEEQIDLITAECQRQVDGVLNIDRNEAGIFVVASTLGSLEALIKFINDKHKDVPIAGTSIGTINKKEVMRASVALEKEPDYACILAFDVDINDRAREYAEHVGVEIFQSDIIYHLQEEFAAYHTDCIERKRDSHVVFPVQLKIFPDKIFNAKNPIILGVHVEKGSLRIGTPLVAAKVQVVTAKVRAPTRSTPKPFWWQSLNERDRSAIIAMYAQGVQHYGSLTNELKTDLENKFHLSSDQISDLQGIVYGKTNRNHAKTIAGFEQNYLFIGVVTEIRVGDQAVSEAKSGSDVAVKIDLTNENDCIIQYRRHFDHTFGLRSRISRESIDAIKHPHYRNELTDEDIWLLRDLKKYFKI